MDAREEKGNFENPQLGLNEFIFGVSKKQKGGKTKITPANKIKLGHVARVNNTHRTLEHQKEYKSKIMNVEEFDYKCINIVYYKNLLLKMKES